MVITDVPNIAITNAWDDVLLLMFPGRMNHVPRDVAAPVNSDYLVNIT